MNTIVVLGYRRSLAIVVVAALVGCSSGSSGSATGAGGSVAGKGGANSSGGTVGGAGAMSTGGASGSGGIVAGGGGAASAGGVTGAGGATAAGGAIVGAVTTGGVTGSGGAVVNDGPVYMPNFIVGADISRVQQQEDGGMKFKDTDGSQPTGTTITGGGLLTILKKHGFNYVRLRTFVNPKATGGYAASLSQAYCDRDHTAKFAAGVKLAGMGVLLDIQYSDNFADPGTQTKPADWANLSFADLTTQVYTYTKDVVSAMKTAGGRPDIVQIGNEIPQGLLFDASGVTAGTGGKVSGTAFANLAALLKQGIQGVKDADSNIKIMMHLDRCNDLATTQWWVKGVQGQGVAFDVLGQSCYDFTGYQQPSSSWAGNFSTLATGFPGLSFAAAEYSPNPLFVAQVLAGIANKRGLGTFIFEPTSYNNMNSMLFTIASNVATANAAMADFDTITSLYANR